MYKDYYFRNKKGQLNITAAHSFEAAEKLIYVSTNAYADRVLTHRSEMYEKNTINEFFDRIIKRPEVNNNNINVYEIIRNSLLCFCQCQKISNDEKRYNRERYYRHRIKEQTMIINDMIKKELHVEFNKYVLDYVNGARKQIKIVPVFHCILTWNDEEETPPFKYNKMFVLPHAPEPQINLEDDEGKPFPTNTKGLGAMSVPKTRSRKPKS